MRPIEYGSLQEAAAVLAFRKRRQIDLLKVLVQAAAAIGDKDNLSKYYDQLLEAVEPDIKEIRKAKHERDSKLLQEETKKAYNVKESTLAPKNPYKRSGLRRKKRRN